jgi:hypothetical protein
MKRLAWAFALMAAPVWAGAIANTGGEGAGFGNVPAEPSWHEDLIPGVTITTSIFLDGPGRSAMQVSRLAPLRLDSFITVQKGTGPQRVKLHCRAVWVNAAGIETGWSHDVPDCLDATLTDDSLPTRLAMTFRFTPGKDDPVGTSGFRVEIEDEISGASGLLQVTYGWRGLQQ